MTTDTMRATIASYHAELTAIRRDIHAHPEMGLEEVRTAALVAAKLREWGIDPAKYATYEEKAMQGWLDLKEAKRAARRLQKRNLTNAKLILAGLTFAKLSGANFNSANLTGANLWGAKLTGGDFTDADLTDAFMRPGISRADMEGADGLDTAKGLVD